MNVLTTVIREYFGLIKQRYGLPTLTNQIQKERFHRSRNC